MRHLRATVQDRAVGCQRKIKEIQRPEACFSAEKDAKRMFGREARQERWLSHEAGRYAPLEL